MRWACALLRALHYTVLCAVLVLLVVWWPVLDEFMWCYPPCRRWWVRVGARVGAQIRVPGGTV